MPIIRRLFGIALGALVTYGLRSLVRRRVEDYRERFQDLDKENYGNIDDLDVTGHKKDETKEEE
jgi:hypothetical protein